MGRGMRIKSNAPTNSYRPMGLKEDTVRDFGLEDRDLFTPMLELINADRLKGQPVCDIKMLQEALRGRSPIDNAYWQDLKELHHIYSSSADLITGVLAYGVRKDGTGVILWSHTRELLEPTQNLIEIALEELKDCDQIEAFPHANALGVGLEGLPASRKTTDAVLNKAGFSSEDLWLYMDYKVSPSDKDIKQNKEISTKETKDETLPGQRYFNLSYKNSLAKAEFSINADVGTLWWIEVKDEAKGKGLGREMIKEIKRLAATEGAKEIILFVDHDEPDNPDRDRRPAVSLYLSEGWKEIDHLLSYGKVKRS